MEESPCHPGKPHLWRREPPVALRPLVTGIYGYAEGGTPMRGHVEPASLDVPLIVNFGSPFRIGLGRVPNQADRQASFAAGLFAGPVIMDSDGAAQCIQVNFTPLGGRLFFARPMSELADCMVELDALGDRGILELADRLGDLDAWESRLDLVVRFLDQRLLGTGTAKPEIAWAYGQLLHSAGGMAIGTLARQLAWSRRRLVAHFREDIGLPPKAVARIIRFNAARALASGGTPAGWADVAAACGYADQAHLSREFAALAGSPPKRWLAAA